MLVLTRKKGERVIINDDIAVQVMSIRGSQVVMGFDAPTKHEVHREEVYQRIQLEKVKASLDDKKPHH